MLVKEIVKIGWFQVFAVHLREREKRKPTDSWKSLCWWRMVLIRGVSNISPQTNVMAKWKWCQIKGTTNRLTFHTNCRFLQCMMTTTGLLSSFNLSCLQLRAIGYNRTFACSTKKPQHDTTPSNWDGCFKSAIWTDWFPLMICHP